MPPKTGQPNPARFTMYLRHEQLTGVIVGAVVSGRPPFEASIWRTGGPGGPPLQ
jgi:hypothetical protein